MALVGGLFGRWIARWLFRGGPVAIAAKLAGVGLWAAWRWRREQKRLEREARSRRIDADWEILDEPDPDPGAEPRNQDRPGV